MPLQASAVAMFPLTMVRSSGVVGGLPTSADPGIVAVLNAESVRGKVLSSICECNASTCW